MASPSPLTPYSLPFQCESPNEVISRPEKNVPMMFPRVIGRSRCEGES